MAEPRIKAYFHCKTCMSGQLAVGWTVQGVQIFCEKCQLSVADLDFCGNKVKYYEALPDENSQAQL